ncbi:MAG TPA: OB-fold domain-containing protein [Nitrososphaera sp.]|nr:OB-fold domain-containing protein [Nitrososphaera sp.]
MMEKVATHEESRYQKFIEAANRKKILAHKCVKCGHLMLETVFFCEKCSSSQFEHVELDGSGTVVTYTIQAVAPEGFEDAGSYAWVVFRVDNSPLRASGFLPGIKTQADLPIGASVRVVGYDQKHGLVLEKV